jgi:hypothetical protein
VQGGQEGKPGRFTVINGETSSAQDTGYISAEAAMRDYDAKRGRGRRQVLEVLCAPSATGYPSFMGPGVPKERVETIRTAYTAATTEPEFIDAILKGGLDIDPIGADELTEVVRGIYVLPETAVARPRELLPAQ